MKKSESRFDAELRRRGVSRREFVAFCGVMASTLALPRSLEAKIAAALQKSEKPVLVWLEFQDCAGNTESFLRATKPTAAEVVLDTLSVDYHETIMAAAGHQAEENLAKTVKDRKGADTESVQKPTRGPPVPTSNKTQARRPTHGGAFSAPGRGGPRTVAPAAPTSARASTW